MCAPCVRQAGLCENVVRMFFSGALILDEVDLILHPLKSELNWPIGSTYICQEAEQTKTEKQKWKQASNPAHICALLVVTD
jgi:hypothetical protein